MKRLLILVLLLAGKLTAVKGWAGTVVRWYSPSIVRVMKYADGHSVNEHSLAVTMEMEKKVKVDRQETDSHIIERSKKLVVEINKQTGAVIFRTVDGMQLLSEKATSLTERTTGVDRGSYIVAQTYQLDADEPVYGLGITQDGRFSRRGAHYHMVQSNREDFQNIVQSVKGWALLWDNASPTDFTDNPDGMTFSSEVGDGVDYYFMYGGDADGCVAQIRQLTGSVPMPPLWSLGFFQSRERYVSLDQLTGVVHRYRDLGIPLDCIVQDWQYWGSWDQWNAMAFHGQPFANAAQAIDDVHRSHVNFMITVWPNFGGRVPCGADMERAGHLLHFKKMPMPCYDPFSKEARDIYWHHLDSLRLQGIDAWWMDATEPDEANFVDEDYELTVDGGRASFRRLCNAYPLATVGGVYEHQLQADPDRRPFIMTRSVWAGQQRFGAHVWSGDITSSWQTLRAQVPAGLNFILEGNPNFNTDIGGFFARDYNHGNVQAYDNPAYRELYTRWMEYGLLCPVMRSHGTDAPREIYLYGKAGEPVYDALLGTIRLRYRLIPYLYSQAWQVASQNASYMRPLIADFKADRRTWEMGDEFMVGNSILAAPILAAQYTTENKGGEEDASAVVDNVENRQPDFTQYRTTTKYLPAGTGWYDFFTGRHYQGGQDVQLQTTLSSIPLFVRDGSILPFGPEMQHTAEVTDAVQPAANPWKELELRVYPGGDAHFTLYEDDGKTNDYQKGAYATIDISWNDHRRQLTLGRRQGMYPGMLSQRTFVIVLPDGTSRKVEYKGEKLKVKM